MVCIISEGSPVEFEIFVFKYTILHLPTPNLICHFSAHSHTPLWDSVVCIPIGLTFHFPQKTWCHLQISSSHCVLRLPDDLLKFQSRCSILTAGQLCWLCSTQRSAWHISNILLISNPGTVPLRCPPSQRPSVSLSESPWEALLPAEFPQKVLVLWGSGVLAFSRDPSILLVRVRNQNSLVHGPQVSSKMTLVGIVVILGPAYFPLDPAISVHTCSCRLPLHLWLEGLLWPQAHTLPRQGRKPEVLRNFTARAALQH